MNIAQVIDVFRKYEQLGKSAFNQIGGQQFHWQPDPESNSIAIIIRHLHGNMLSRWTDFLSSDGEKTGRNRDNEFERTQLEKDELVRLWDQGWRVLFSTLESLTEEDLNKTILIRGEKHLVSEALLRQVAHYAYHVGQIVFIAKMILKDRWNTLSIKKGESDQFNQSMFLKA